MSKTKLLLADDSITIQKVVNLTFADQGMDVVAFSDGDAAIEHFDTVKPDIVLADVHMPGVNGYQLCELLRSDAASSKIPVVLLVGSFEPFDREEAERVGASGFLTKPFASIAELVSTVENLLTEPKPAEPQATADELPKPDTSDIDHLYERSFAETVEIPRDADEELEFDEIALDDEMIQTTFGEPDPSHDIEETYYSEEVNSAAETAEAGPVHEAETLIARSVHEEMLGSGPAVEYAPEQGTETDQLNETGWAAAEPQPKSSPGPFDSVATDLPPIEVTQATGALVSDTVEFDVLELPETLRPGRPGGASGAGTDAAGQITSLSPELIDLIVEKVVARLEEKQATAAGE